MNVIPDSELNVEARIDTFALSFPVTPEVELEGASVMTVAAGTDDEQQTWRRKLPGGGFLAGGVGGSAWVEASLPKRVGDNNVDGLVLEDAIQVARDMYEEALQFVVPFEFARVSNVIRGLDETRAQPEAFATGFDGAKIIRCDLVRDFVDVTELPAFLDALATVRQRGGHKVARYADAEAGRAETLRVGPKGAWSCTLYDKYAESGARAADRRRNSQESLWIAGDTHLPTPVDERVPRAEGLCDPGRMRFEARCRPDLSTQKYMIERGAGVPLHMKQLFADLHETEIALKRTTKVMFERVGFDREVSGIAQVSAKINAIPAEDMTPRTKRELVGYLASAAMGIDLQWSRNTESRYRRMAEELGIVVAPGELGESFIARLDYDAGTEEIVLAA